MLAADAAPQPRHCRRTRHHDGTTVSAPYRRHRRHSGRHGGTTAVLAARSPPSILSLRCRRRSWRCCGIAAAAPPPLSLQRRHRGSGTAAPLATRAAPYTRHRRDTGHHDGATAAIPHPRHRRQSGRHSHTMAVLAARAVLVTRAPPSYWSLRHRRRSWRSRGITAVLVAALTPPSFLPRLRHRRSRHRRSPSRRDGIGCRYGRLHVFLRRCHHLPGRTSMNIPCGGDDAGGSFDRRGGLVDGTATPGRQWDGLVTC